MKIGASERFFLLYFPIFLFPKIGSHIILCTSQVHIIIREVPHYVKLSNFTLVGGENP